MSAPEVWVLRAGRDDEFAATALERGVVGLGWRRVGDLGGVTSERAVRSSVARSYPDQPGDLRMFTALQLHAFRNLIAPGHLVVLLRRTTSDVAVGEVTGDYRFESGDGPAHVRPVNWLQPRLHRSELGLLLAVPALQVVTRVTRSDDRLRVADAAKGVAPTEEPAVRPAGKPVDVLRANLEHARNLANAGEHLEKLGVTSFEFRDVYRAAWAQAVASMDHWVASEIAGRTRELLAGPADRWPPTFGRVVLSHRWSKARAAGEDAVRTALEKELARGRTSYHSAESIGQAFQDVTGIPDLWVRVGATMRPAIAAADVEWALTRTVQRRHKIVHRYDEDPENPPHKKAIALAETLGAIDLLGVLAETILVVLADA